MASPRMRAASMAMDEVLLELALSGEIGQAARAQARFKLQIFGLAIAGNQFPVGHVLPAYRTSSRARRKSGSNSGGAPGGLGLAHRGFGLRPRAAQVEQRREHVLIDRRERVGAAACRLFAAWPRAACRAVPAPCARRSSCRRPGCAPAGPLRRGGWRGSGPAPPARRES